MSNSRTKIDYYGATYGRFGEEVYAEVRSEAFGEDIGQNGWLTAAEQDRFLTWLNLAAGRRLLDLACGSGGPALRIARITGCQVHGIDIHEDAVATARAQAQRIDLASRATFERIDASATLPFADASFDAVLCVDAVNHLPNRSQVLAEWARVLVPGGRLVFTDPIVVTGPLTNEEIAIRSSIGFFLFVPAEFDEQAIEAAGLCVVAKEDRTDNMANIAQRWHAAREARTAELRRIEGDETFAGQQRFFEIAARVARERRLSRFAFCAERPRSG